MKMSKMLIGFRKILRAQWTLLILRIAVGLVFVIASIDKLDHPDRFTEIIMDYQIVPWSTALIMAIWLPWLELIVGTILILGVWVRASALLLAGLTALFVLALSSALIRGIDLACGCFSVSELTQARTWSSLWQESILLLGCIWLWVGHWPGAGVESSGISNTLGNEGANK